LESITVSILKLRGIEKSFDQTTVIHGVDLDVHAGEFVVLVGPSGCGKSTLLRMIAGLDAPTAGDVWISGQRVNQVSAADRGCAMVFQSYALYPHMSVYANMAFGLENIGESKSEIARKVGEAAAILKLEALLERRPTQLSGGQRQRVAIGRAIVREPKLFLFDEPLSNLDAELRVSMRAELRELHRRLGSTMIYVTHDQVEAMSMADKIVVLRGGRIEQVGTPQMLYNQPANTFVAGFIGSPRMNFIPLASWTERVSSMPPTTAEPTQALTAAWPPGTHTVGVRPEHWERASTQAAWVLTVQSVEYLGGQQLVQGHFPCQTRIEVLWEGSPPVQIGERLSLQVKPGQAHAFDAQGQRLGGTSA
jgi:ABC-type sugar transport system ATPase subunit